MTKRERSHRPDRPSRERFPDALLDRYLLDRSSRDGASGDRGVPDSSVPDRGVPDRDALPDGDPARSQPVARVLTALTSAPESSELTGEARALAEFRAFGESGAFAESGAAPARGADLRPPARRRVPRRMTWLPGRRLALATATGAVLMGGLLAVAYAGELPVAVQRLAHHTIDAPAARPDRDPAVSPQRSGPPRSAGQAGQQTPHALVRPDREVANGSVSGHPHRPRAFSSPSASASGRPGSGRSGSGRPGSGQPGSGQPGSGRQGGSGRPGRAGEPGPVQAPWPSASVSPPGSATPSPSAAPSPSQSAPPHPQPSPSSSQSTPP
jgi:hypothetical protein